MSIKQKLIRAIRKDLKITWQLSFSNDDNFMCYTYQVLAANMFIDHLKNTYEAIPNLIEYYLDYFDEMACEKSPIADYFSVSRDYISTIEEFYYKIKENEK